MKTRVSALAIVIFSWSTYLRTVPGRAQSSPSIALTGRVSSVPEGPMEGVLVGAKKAGSTITVTVVSDAHGRYRFPSSKLSPGQYTLRIRAVGYDLESPTTVDVGTGDVGAA